MAFKLLLLLVTVSSIDCSYEGWLNYMKDYYGSYYKRQDIQEVPTVGSTNPIENIVQFSSQGRLYIQKVVNNTGNTVFKVMLLEDTVVIADPVAIRAIYKTNLIEKENDLVIARFNLVTLKKELPSMTTNGQLHKRQKRIQMKFLWKRLKEFPLEKMFETLQEEINNYQPINNGVGVDFDTIWQNITIDTLTKFSFGEALRDKTLYDTWFSKMAELKEELLPTPDPTDEDEIEVANKVLERLKNSPVYKDIKKLKRRSGFSQDQIDQQIIFFVYFFQVGGARFSVPSAVANYYRLSAEDRQKIIKEANDFFKELDEEQHPEPNDMSDQDVEKLLSDKRRKKKNRFQKLLNKLKWIERFAVENMRFFTPALTVSARAKRDFVVPSLSGKFQIRKGQYLTGRIFTTERNKDTFESPDEFSLDRNQRKVKENFFIFGGPYNQRPKTTNRKCLGQKFTINLLKMVVLQLTKCTIEPANEWTFNNTNSRRLIATDGPMQIKTFSCKDL